MIDTIKVALLFGGQSPEHDVSIESAKFIYTALLDAGYTCLLIGIDRDGVWRLAPSIDFPVSDWPPIALLPGCRGDVLDVASARIIDSVDVVFPAVHGPYCEDGSIQGLLKLANVAFIGPSVTSSANCMDKAICKTLLTNAGIPSTDYISGTSDTIPAFGDVKEILGTPLFIKPANMGSSVGVQKINTDAEYASAVQSALQYDKKILIEKFIDGKEVECAVLCKAEPEASLPGIVMPSSSHEFYTYQSKYTDEKGAKYIIPADLPDDTIAGIQEISLAASTALECEGMVRVDLFLLKNGGMMINELNTIPGFTSISMYPKLWQATGVSSAELVRYLVDHALARLDKEQSRASQYRLSAM